MLAFTSVREDVPLEEVTRDLERLSHEAQAADQPALAAAVLKAQDALEQAPSRRRRRARAASCSRGAGRLRRDRRPSRPASRRQRAGAAAPMAPITLVEDFEHDDEMREIFLEEAREVVERRAAQRRAAADARRPRAADHAAPRLPHAQGQLAHGRAERFGEAAWACEQVSTPSSPSSAPPSAPLLEFSALGARLSRRLGRGHRRARAIGACERARGPRPLPTRCAGTDGAARLPRHRRCRMRHAAADLPSQRRPASCAPPAADSSAAGRARRAVAEPRPSEPAERCRPRARPDPRRRVGRACPSMLDAADAPALAVEPLSTDAAQRRRCRRRSTIRCSRPMPSGASTSISTPRRRRRHRSEPGAERRAARPATRRRPRLCSTAQRLDAGRRRRDAVGAGGAASRSRCRERADAERRAASRSIGPLRIGIPLFNIYLNEADERSRRLATEVAEWAMELHRPVGEVADRAGAFAGRQLGDGRLHAICRSSRARSSMRCAHPGHRPRHAARRRACSSTPPRKSAACCTSSPPAS